jgi:hypothetical protein
MRITHDDLRFCEDCTIVACNGDYSGIEYSHGVGTEETDARCAEIDGGLAKLGPHVVPNFDDESGTWEFSSAPCDCCGTRLAGSRHRFAILAP